MAPNMTADNKTKLILHVDHLYKIKFFHHHDSGCCESNLEQLLIDKDAGEDIDKIIRGLIYLSQRNQILKTVCSDRFVVKFNRKPWKISWKITFKKNGKIMKVCPFFFEVILTCKKSYCTKQQDKNNSALEGNIMTEKSNTTERCETRSSSQRETRSSSQRETRSSSRLETRSSSQRVQNGSNQPSEEQNKHARDTKVANETRYSSVSRKQKRPLKRLPSREKKPHRMQRNFSCDEGLSVLSFDKNEISSSSEDENNESENEEKCSRRKNRRAKAKSSRDWLDRTRNVLVESPDTHFNTSGDIPLRVLTEVSVKKRKRDNESLLEKTCTRKRDQTMVVGKSYQEALDTLEEEEGQVADILGTTLKKSDRNCTTAMDNVSVVDQSCKRKRGLNLYKGTDAPLINLPSLDNSLVDPSSNVTQHLNFKDSFLSPCVGSDKEFRNGKKLDLYTSFTPLSRFNRSQKGGEMHEKKKRVDFPVKDRHFIEREEIAEDIKLQEMSKADSSGTKSGSQRLSFGKSLWETLDTYFISPVKMIFEGN